jgi:hypothetical protein
MTKLLPGEVMGGLSKPAQTFMEMPVLRGFHQLWVAS